MGHLDENSTPSQLNFRIGVQCQSWTQSGQWDSQRQWQVGRTLDTDTSSSYSFAAVDCQSLCLRFITWLLCNHPTTNHITTFTTTETKKGWAKSERFKSCLVVCSPPAKSFPPPKGLERYGFVSFQQKATLLKMNVSRNTHEQSLWTSQTQLVVC